MSYQAFWNIKFVLAKTTGNLQDINHWPTFCYKVEKLRPYQRWKQVIWSFPPVGYLHESGTDGIGGIVRDSLGNLIMTFSISVNCYNSNMAESLAAEFGVKWCYPVAESEF
ncbi:hypothetical protein MTR67_046638 [Solanum verrucosum]|uniref:Uncharacterized protein n=1 Tax=Solanum verrucosum TaxID=315347 RepID=A0AAF0ZXE8_SOLVR|nr:hypothetical protein MTR67_046638 [Solanum verrucosum]